MDARAYLERIGLDGAVPATADGLARVTSAHLLAVPFENLDIGAGRPIVLDLARIYDKIVVRRRGGFCYELNGLFAWLLRELGFAVTMLAARAVGEDGELGPEFDHLVLRVDLDEPVLVDVGFGEAYRGPLPLRDGAEHVDPSIGSYRLDAGPDGSWNMVEQLDATPRRRAGYRFDLVPRTLEDFAPTCRWQQTDSPFFTRRRFCTLATEGGRVTLMDDRLIVLANGARTERRVAEAEVPGLLERLFGVVV